MNTKTKLTIIALLLSIAVVAQKTEVNFISDYSFNAANFQPVFLSHLNMKIKSDVDQQHFVITNRKGNKTEYYKEFNENGQLLKYYKKDAKKSTVAIAEFEYEDANGKTATYYKKGKMKYRIDQNWENGRLIENKQTNEKGVVLKKTTWQYNSDGCLVSTARFKKHDVLKNKWEYEYYDKCDRSRSKIYNGKGKLISVWTYDCNQEGEKLTTKADTVQVCQWSEISADYIVKVQQTFDEKGKIVKHVSKYSASDTTILESATYDQNENLLYRSVYDKNNHKILKMEHFKKGEKSASFEYTYENNMLASYGYIHKNKLRWRCEYDFSGDKLTEQRTYGKKNKWVSTIKIEYGKPLASNETKQ